MADTIGEIEHGPQNLAVSKPDYDLFLQPSESEIKIEYLSYHGKSIKLFQIEHAEISDENTGEPLSVPKDWPEKLSLEINTGDKVFLQYFPPELKKIRNMPIVGHFVGIWAQQSGIDIFANMAEIATQKGADIFVADIASTVGYAFHELAIDQPKWKAEMLKRPMEKRKYYSGHQEPIDPIEITMPRAIDARRLGTARALMQESMGSTTEGDIIWVGPEANGKRIKNYIERQIEFESKQSPLSNPKDMKNNCPPEEYNKITRYKYTPGFNNKIRHYSKTNNGWSLIDKKPIY